MKLRSSQVYLYLRNTSFDTFDIESDVNRDCMRPYIIQPVDFSNMLLLVVNTECADTASPSLSVIPEEVMYENNSLVCQKALAPLGRKKPASCIRSHHRESEIKDLCGLASNAGPNIYLLLLLLATCALIKRDISAHN